MTKWVTLCHPDSEVKWINTNAESSTGSLRGVRILMVHLRNVTRKTMIGLCAQRIASSQRKDSFAQFLHPHFLQSGF